MRLFVEPSALVGFGLTDELVIGQVDDGATWEGRFKTTLNNYVVTRLDTANCEFETVAGYSFEYELVVTNPDSSVSLNVSDTKTGQLTNTYSQSPCDPANFVITLENDLISPGANPSIIDTGSFVRSIATQKPFTPFGPTCANVVS